MNFLVDLIKGVFVGIANVIPGVSGGTMAVSFGIYDKLLNAISSLLKSFKKSFLTLLPIILGMVIGIVGFTYIIPWLLANFPFATSCAFTGLIIGGIPAILRSLKDGWQSEEKKSLLVNILVFLILLAVAMAMVFLNGDSESGIALTASAGMLVKIFFMGIIASATMVIPGVSGSLVLMILGYYFGVINSVKQFVEALRTLNLQGMLNQLFILIPFAIGCVLGIFFISKLISYLLKHFASATFSGIFALVASSPISIFYKVNQEYSMNGTSVVSIIVGVVLLVACVALTLFMEKLEHRNLRCPSLSYDSFLHKAVRLIGQLCLAKSGIPIFFPVYIGIVRQFPSDKFPIDHGIRTLYICVCLFKMHIKRIFCQSFSQCKCYNLALCTDSPPIMPNIFRCASA